MFALAFGWLALNLRAALRAPHARAFALMTPEGPVTVSVEAKLLRLLGNVLAAVVAGVMALFAASRWETGSALLVRDAVRQQRPDPRAGTWASTSSGSRS